MMIKAALLLAAFVAAVLFLWKRGTPQKAQVEGPIASWTVPDKWSIGRGEREGKPIITRFNKGLQRLVGQRPFTKQVGIAVPFVHPSGWDL
jgi:hypothetical protein